MEATHLPGDGLGHFQIRARGTDPRDPACKLHLRRICGTCTHYTGALTDPATAPALCSYFNIPKTARRRAWSCNRWSRK